MAEWKLIITPHPLCLWSTLWGQTSFKPTFKAIKLSPLILKKYFSFLAFFIFFSLFHSLLEILLLFVSGQPQPLRERQNMMIKGYKLQNQILGKLCSMNLNFILLSNTVYPVVSFLRLGRMFVNYSNWHQIFCSLLLLLCKWLKSLTTNFKLCSKFYICNFLVDINEEISLEKFLLNLSITTLISFPPNSDDVASFGSMLFFSHLQCSTNKLLVILFKLLIFSHPKMTFHSHCYLNDSKSVDVPITVVHKGCMHSLLPKLVTTPFCSQSTSLKHKYDIKTTYCLLFFLSKIEVSLITSPAQESKAHLGQSQSSDEQGTCHLETC